MLEEFVGEIYDEHDEREEKKVPPVKKKAARSGSPPKTRPHAKP